MLPLLFVCVSQHRPLRVRNPIRCNRRILSQPCFHRSYSPRYPFGAPLRSHLLYLSVPFLSALRNVLCKTSMINTLFLIAFAYSYSSTGNPDCQCSFCCHAIVNVYNGILYKVIFITYIRGYKMKKSKLPKQALIILSIALVLVISTVMWSSAQITQDTEEE